MGGFGSGRWNHTPTRRQADGSFRLRAPPAWMVAEGRGVFIWHRTGRRALDFFVRVGITGACAELCHPYGRAFVGLESTPSNLRGLRWWWLCPDCGRRCLKLYLPPRSRHFACRVCHDLSYESAQSSRASYYKLFKSSARQFNSGLEGPQASYLRSIGIRPLTATYFREHIRAGIGGFTTAPYEGRPERLEHSVTSAGVKYSERTASESREKAVKGRPK